MFAQAVVSRLGEREIVRHVARLGELDRHAEFSLPRSHEHEDLPLHLDGPLAPGELLVGLRIAQRMLPKERFNLCSSRLFRHHCTSKVMIVFGSNRISSFFDG